jgi:integrase
VVRVGGPSPSRRGRWSRFGSSVVVSSSDSQRADGGRTPGLVFTTSTGQPIDASRIVREYHAMTNRLGLPRRPWYSLRHFVATAMLEAGADIYTVSRMLGHASITTTANVYGHVTPATLRRSADLMDRALSG